MREMRVSSGGLAGTLAHLTCTRIPPTKLRERPASSSTERWGCTATHTVTVPLAGNGTSSARCIHPSSANTKTCFARFDVTVSTRGSPDRFDGHLGMLQGCAVGVLHSALAAARGMRTSAIEVPARISSRRSWAHRCEELS